MKVLITSRWYPSKTNPISGVFVQEYVKAIKLYNEVRVLIPPSGQEKLKRVIIIKEREESGIKVIRIYYKKFKFRIINSFLTHYSVFKAVRSLIQSNWRPDIIHCNVFHSALSFLPLKFILKIPIVLSEHWSGLITGNLLFKEKLLLKLILKSSDKILPVSMQLCNSINKYTYIKKKCEVVFNTVNTSLFSKKGIQKKSKKIKIISVGGLVEVKGFDKLIEAINLVSKERDDFHLTIVGEGNLKNSLLDKIKELKLNKFITLTGSKTKQEISKLFDKSNFFILSSFIETFGVAVVEAMSKGLPVIVTRCGGPEEFVKSFCGKIIKDNNPGRLAKAIKYMLNNYSRYNSQKISDYVKANFSYEVIGKKFNRIYREVINKKSGV